MSRPRVFISAVSLELANARQAVASALLAMGYEPEWQDVFETEAGDLREMLRRRIRGCRGVIHLVGERFGAELPEPDPERGRLSYAQFEAVYARAIGKPVWTLVTGPDFPTSDLPAEPAELRALQQSYRASIVAGSSDLFHPVESLDQVELATLRMRTELADLRRRGRRVLFGLGAVSVGTLTAVTWVALTQREVADRTGAAVEASSRAAIEASAARSAAEGSRQSLERVHSQAAIENARRSLEEAVAAGDRALRATSRAMEVLVASGQNHSGASLNGISLVRAELDGVDLSGTSLLDADLGGVSLVGGSLRSANLRFASLVDARCASADMGETLLEYSDCRGASFTGARIERASLFFSDLRGADFSGADLRGACLAYCDLSGAVLRGADLTDAIFFSSVLDESDWREAVVVNVDVGAAVGRGLILAEQDRYELRRADPLHRFLDIEVWGHAVDSDDWDASYPDFSSYGTAITRIPHRYPESLRQRDPGSVSPVGVFHEYGGDLPNDLRAPLWFPAPFWRAPGRRERILGFLEGHGERLFQALSTRAPVEGDRSFEGREPAADAAVPSGDSR